ncbi:MAG: zinc ABC transporter substrate-binding protein [Candidatus Falkowbacteria bacterium]
MVSKKSSIIIVLAITLLASVFVFWAVKARHDSLLIPTASSQRLSVVTTLFPLYDMARAIGGDRVDARLLLPPGVEAHAFEPKPSDLARIGQADLFIYTGGLMEPWAKGVLSGIISAKLKVVDVSRGAILKPTVFHENIQAGTTDPHFWLDFGNAKQMAGIMAQAFAAADPPSQAYFQERLVVYTAELDRLDNQYRQTLSGCAQKEIVYAGHYAFGYLASRYGLKYLAAQGVAPDAEPTAQDLARLVKQLRGNDIKFVFYEELSSPKLAQTIADEAGARLLLLNAGHNVTKDQLEQGMTFFAIMEADLANLKIGLDCP